MLSLSAWKKAPPHRHPRLPLHDPNPNNGTYVLQFESVYSKFFRFVKECFRMQEMEQPSRRVWIAATAVTGLFIMLGFMTAVYVLEHSPNVDIPIYKNGVVVRTQDKGEALIGPLVPQVFFFLVMLYYCFTWDRFVHRGIERVAAANAQVEVARLLRVVSYAAICMDVFVLSIIVYNSVRLLNL